MDSTTAENSKINEENTSTSENSTPNTSTESSTTTEPNSTNSQSQPECCYFKRGLCKFGDNFCRFKHTNETQFCQFGASCYFNGNHTNFSSQPISNHLINPNSHISETILQDPSVVGVGGVLSNYSFDENGNPIPVVPVNLPMDGSNGSNGLSQFLPIPFQVHPMSMFLNPLNPMNFQQGHYNPQIQSFGNVYGNPNNYRGYQGGRQINQNYGSQKQWNNSNGNIMNSNNNNNNSNMNNNANYQNQSYSNHNQNYHSKKGYHHTNGNSNYNITAIPSPNSPIQQQYSTQHRKKNSRDFEKSSGPTSSWKQKNPKPTNKSTDEKRKENSNTSKINFYAAIHLEVEDGQIFELPVILLNTKTQKEKAFHKYILPHSSNTANLESNLKKLGIDQKEFKDAKPIDEVLKSLEAFFNENGVKLNEGTLAFVASDVEKNQIMKQCQTSNVPFPEYFENNIWTPTKDLHEKESTSSSSSSTSASTTESKEKNLTDAMDQLSVSKESKNLDSTTKTSI